MPARTLFAALFFLFACSRSHAELIIDAPGADPAVVANIRTFLRLSKEPCDAPQWRVKRLYQRLDDEIEPAVHAFGYYGASTSKELKFAKKCWQVRLKVDLGEPVRIRALDVEISGEATADEAFAKLRTRLPLQPGDALHHGQYEAIKSSLSDLALQRGYFDAAFQHSTLRIYPDTDAADINIAFASGQRYRFGALELNDQPLADDFVRRLAALKPGSYYDAGVVAELNRNLSDAGYFRSVEVRTRRDLADDQTVPISVALTPLPRHSWRAGIGYATDTGPRGSLGYENRYINQRGHRFSSELRLSPVESGLSLNYRIPGRDPHKWTFEVFGGFLHEDTDSTDSDSIHLTARQTFRHKRWTERRFIELLRERSTLGSETTRATLVMPGWGLNKSHSDNPLRTRRGYRLDFEVRGAYEGLLSDASLVQLRGSAKGIYRFGEGGRVKARADIGATLADDFTQLPASLRFFAGGDNSVRGYAYKSLGPQDADNEVVGGKNLFTASVEYEHPVVRDDWWAAAFVDAGNAFDTQSLTVKYGYGLGVRWYSPVGRLRLDVAFPNDTSEDSWRLHFGLGADL